jgi:hypothetical protein
MKVKDFRRRLKTLGTPGEGWRDGPSAPSGGGGVISLRRQEPRPNDPKNARAKRPPWHAMGCTVAVYGSVLGGYGSVKDRENTP